jgi:hypothetical protein
MALLIAVLLLIMVSAIGVAAIDHAGSEQEVAGHARRTATTFYAADAGLEYGRQRILNRPPVLDGFSVTLDDGQTTFRSGPRSAGSAVDLTPPTTAAPPDGFSINVGGAGGFVSLNTTFNITGQGPGNSVVELESRVTQTSSGYGRY